MSSLSSKSEKSEKISQRVLITGGAGFIGTHLGRLLVDQGYSVRSLDIKDPRTAVKGVDYIRGDVRNEENLRSAVQDADSVFHFAAVVNIAECQEKPAESYATNFMGTVKVLESVRQEAQRRGSAPRVVFAGSSAVYGMSGKKGVPIRESDVSAHPLSYYANQKQASEDVIRLYRQHAGIPAVIFRFFNVYGVGQDPASPYSGVITIFSRLAREGRDLPLNGGGTQTRDFISVLDIARANLSALRLDPAFCDGQAINLGTGSSISIRQLGEMISKISKSHGYAQGRLVDAPARAGDVPHSMADVTRALEILRWKNQVELENGLGEIL